MIAQHIQDNQEIRPSQQRFAESRSSLTNGSPLMSIYGLDTGKAVDVVCLNFDTSSNNILLEKLAAHGLDRHCSLCKKSVWLGLKSGGG